METRSKTRANTPKSPVKVETKGEKSESPTKLSNRGKRWTDLDRSVMLDSLTEGKSFKEIGEKLGRSDKAIELEFAKQVHEANKKDIKVENLPDYFEVDESLITKALKTKLSYERTEGSKKTIKNPDDLVETMKKLNERNERVIQLLEENNALKSKINELEKELQDLLRKAKKDT